MRTDELLFLYPGSKSKLVKRYLRHFPPHRVFVDAFGGTGSLIIRKPPSPVEIYHDLDGDVCNVFEVLQDMPASEELIRLLENTPNGRQQYQACKAILADPNEAKVRRAWAFLMCGNTGFNGHPAIANSWSRPDKQRNRLLRMPEKVIRWRDRFRQVYLENKPWQAIIDKYDSPETLFFLDPPYVPHVLRADARHYYRHTMPLGEHIELIERLRRLQGYAFICGYHHPTYTELLFHWRKIKFEVTTTMGGNKRDKRIERVWLNYEDDGSKIEGNRLRIAQRYLKIMGSEEEARKYLERVAELKRLPK